MSPPTSSVAARGRRSPPPEARRPSCRSLRLRARTQHVSEQCLAHREFSWVAEQMKAEPVHHVAEPDAGVGVGEAKRTAETWCAESFVGRPEHTQRHRLCQSQYIHQVD